MIKKLLLVIGLAFLISPITLLAQRYKRADLMVTFNPSKISLVEEDGEVDLSFFISIPADYVRKSEQYVLTPILTDGERSLPLSSVFVDGKRYSKMAQRDTNGRFVNHKINALSSMEGAIHLTASESMRIVRYSLTIPYERWMDGAELIIVEHINTKHHSELISEMVYAVGVEPSQSSRPRVITRPVKIVNMMEGDVRISFPVGSSKIDMMLDSNMLEMRRLRAMLNGILDDTSNVVDSIVITASNSPEGDYAYNEMLAISRAASVKKALMQGSDFNPKLSDKVITRYIPENWQMLKSYIKSSNIRDKKQVLEAISKPQLANREKSMLSLPQYPYLKEHIFPLLRYVKYQIFYHSTQMEQVAVLVAPKPIEKSHNMMVSSPIIYNYHHNEGYRYRKYIDNDKRENERQSRRNKRRAEEYRVVEKNRRRAIHEREGYKDKVSPHYLRYNR